MKPLLLLLSLSVYALAQSGQGRIVGTVTDSSGAVLPKSVVTVTENKTGAKREVTPDAKGYYVITNLAPSIYTVTATAANFAPAEVREYPLSAGQERTLNLSLQPGSVATEVNVVSGELTEVETSSAAMGANVNSREVGQLPLNGRQLSQLYLLTPGAQTAGGGSFDNIRFSGRANQQNAVRFDGIEASSIIDASPGNLNGEISTGFRLQSSLETVAEFRSNPATTRPNSAPAPAGKISVVTKSGGNTFHGGLFEYLRNNALDARNFFDGAQKSELRLNQYGGSIGGPIKKTSCFSSPPSRIWRSDQASTSWPPCPALPHGLAPWLRSSRCWRAIRRARPPATRIWIWRACRANSMDEYFGSMRLDYHISDKLNAYLRYNRDQGYLQQPLDVSGSYSAVTAVPQNAVLGMQQILTPTVINETKFGFNGSKTRIAGFAPPIPGVDTSAFAVSFTGTVAIPGVGGQGASAGASSLGNLIRSNSTQNGRGQPYTKYTLSFIDSLNVTHQSHSMKFGFELRPVRLYTDRLGGTTYTFSNLNALLANTPSQVQVLGDTSAPDPFNDGATGNRFLKQYYLIGYAQDEWKIRPILP